MNLQQQTPALCFYAYKINELQKIRICIQIRDFVVYISEMSNSKLSLFMNAVLFEPCTLCYLSTLYTCMYSYLLNGIVSEYILCDFP